MEIKKNVFEAENREDFRDFWSREFYDFRGFQVKSEEGNIGIQDKELYDNTHFSLDHGSSLLSHSLDGLININNMFLLNTFNQVV